MQFVSGDSSSWQYGPTTHQRIVLGMAFICMQGVSRLIDALQGGDSVTITLGNYTYQAQACFFE